MEAEESGQNSVARTPIHVERVSQSDGPFNACFRPRKAHRGNRQRQTLSNSGE